MARVECKAVAWPPAMDEVHRANRRRYAQVYVPRGPLELATAARKLPDQHLLGVLAHEVGHLYLAQAHGIPDHTEDEADVGAFEALGVAVAYDRTWPGKGLQYASSAPRRVWGLFR